MNLNLVSFIKSVTSGSLTDGETLEAVASMFGLRDKLAALGSVLQFLHAKGYRTLSDVVDDPVAVQFLGALNDLRVSDPAAFRCSNCGHINFKHEEVKQ